MPSVPYSPVPSVVPSTSVPSDYITTQASPADFGAQVGQAAQRLGGTLGQAGDQTSQTADLYQQRANNIATDKAYNDYQAQTNNALAGDPNNPNDKGYFGLHGQAAVDARPGLNQSLESIRQGIKAGLGNQAQQLEFDQQSRRLSMYTAQRVDSKFEMESNNAALLDNKAGQAIAERSVSIDYNNDAHFQSVLQDQLAKADAQSAMQGANPDTDAGKAIFAYNRMERSQTLYTSRAVAMGTANPAAGLAFVQANSGQFDAITERRLTDEFKGGADQQIVAGGIAAAMAPGGAGGGANTGPIANKTLPPEAQRFLPALSGGEGNYASPAPTGDKSGSPIPNNRYQFLNTTWQTAAPAAGVDVNDRSPASQDAVAWQHAQDVYKASTGGSLQADIAAGGNEAKIAGALNKVWPSLPGGSQQNTTQAQFTARMGGQGGAAGAIAGASPGSARDQAVSPRYFDEIAMIQRAYQNTEPMMATNPKAALAIRNGVMEQIARTNAFENGAQDRASRDLSNHQRDNEAVLFGATVGGQTIGDGDLATYLKTQQITPAGYTAIKSVQQRQAEGQDDPNTVAAVWDGIGTGKVTSDDVYNGLTNGLIKGTTANEMIKSINARGKTQADQLERGAYDTLKTALGGKALENGGMDIFGEGKVAAAQLWTQAQAEWNKRVVSGTEKPDAVLADMMPRYQKSVPVVPAAWPNPRFGAVQSTQDVAAVASKTKAALDSGQIDQAIYQSEGDLLSRYLGYFQIEDARKAAAAKAPPGTRRPAAPLSPGNN
jgi:hypothetical protein